MSENVDPFQKFLFMPLILVNSLHMEPLAYYLILLGGGGLRFLTIYKKKFFFIENLWQ